MKTTIVTTTINIPALLRDYAENARRYGHRDVDFIVVGDRKSPPETADFCKSVPHYPCAYLDVPAQEDYLRRFPELRRHLPFDSISRRNVGMLLAYENGAGVVITIDDDNFVLDSDFIGSHGIAGSTRELPAIASPAGWFNVCSFLREEHGAEFYHRGFPWELRWTESGRPAERLTLSRRVAVNAGFWLDNPDIDALERMRRPLTVLGYKPGAPGQTFALAPGAWCPFNSQNTALMRELLPAYFLSPYIGRYDDIWASYIVTRIAEHLGDVIAYGEPFVRQERNPHDLWKDLDAERNGMILSGGLCGALRSCGLRGRSYHACYGELAAALPGEWSSAPQWTASQAAWRAQFLEGMSIWHAVFESLGAS